RAVITRTDAVPPVVAADEVAARPTVDRAAELLEKRECVCPESAAVISRHEGDGANHARAASDLNAQLAVISRPLRSKIESLLDVCIGLRQSFEQSNFILAIAPA